MEKLRKNKKTSKCVLFVKFFQPPLCMKTKIEVRIAKSLKAVWKVILMPFVNILNFGMRLNMPNSEPFSKCIFS